MRQRRVHVKVLAVVPDVGHRALDPVHGHTGRTRSSRSPRQQSFYGLTIAAPTIVAEMVEKAEKLDLLVGEP